MPPTPANRFNVFLNTLGGLGLLTGSVENIIAMEGLSSFFPGKSKVVSEEFNLHLQYYKNSLTHAGNTINEKKKKKALKDVVGGEYECHRKRVWENLGFTVDKNKNNASFDVDWAIYYQGKLVALEEDKGHYVDSCFFERCIHGFIGTIHNKGDNFPKLILSSFTKYNLHMDKKEKSLELYRDNLVGIFRENYTYNYLNEFDRMPTKKWFSSAVDCNHNPYEEYQNDKLITDDIEFMLSLKEH
jgi:hypothetical protein